MKKLNYAIALTILLAAGAMLAYAQQITANIPFEFHTGKRVLPAGTYTINFSKPDPKTLALHNQSSGSSVQVPIITRLAAKEPSNFDAYLVFDKVDEDRTLAELWVPGIDGFYLGGGLTSHTHVIIKAAK